MDEVGSGEALEGLAEALYLKREYAEAAAHYERAYAAYRREGQSMAAGRAARAAPPELQRLLAAAHGNQEAMDAFARVMAGVTSPAEFFSEQNVGRILANA